MTSQVSTVPDAVGAVIQAVLDEHPAAERSAYGWLIVEALRADGWVVVAPTGRATRAAADPSSAQNGSQGR
ncbi:hypothetical protein [Kitasatospora kifunensis]|uniref:Uncharacterized protein n=1 Tax=Kitasatospora kifunensis TaxID=58351 RepID=A0A7W7VTC8_KITKI|nr:hypothetical protein [Kitasatospora kifunensis]MBB4922156.1 hypothetical protein [Kitasatospora kifunensis]